MQDNSGSTQCEYDAFLARVARDGLSLAFSTYLGGAYGITFAKGVAAGKSGAAYVTGLY